MKSYDLTMEFLAIGLACVLGRSLARDAHRKLFEGDERAEQFSTGTESNRTLETATNTLAK